MSRLTIDGHFGHIKSFTVMNNSVCTHIPVNVWYKFLKVEFLCQGMYALVILKGTAKLPYIEVVPIFTHSNNFWGCIFSYILATLLSFLMLSGKFYSRTPLQLGMTTRLSSGQQTLDGNVTWHSLGTFLKTQFMCTAYHNPLPSCPLPSSSLSFLFSSILELLVVFWSYYM